MWFSKTASVRLQGSQHGQWKRNRKGTAGRNEKLWCSVGTWVRRKVKFIMFAKVLAETARCLEYECQEDWSPEEIFLEMFWTTASSFSTVLYELWALQTQGETAREGSNRLQCSSNLPVQQF